MPFPPIRYLAWAHRHISGEPAPYSLAASTAPHLAPEDLGVDLDGLAWTSPSSQGLPELAEALGARYGIPRERILLTAGCTMANYLVAVACLRPGDAALVETPAYEPLARVAQAVGARVARLRRRPEDGYRLRPARLDRALERTGARLVILTNLHNPTGRSLPAEDVQALGGVARRRGARVLWDEIYREGLPEPPPPAAVLDPEASVSTASLNKVYGLAALKVGWAFAPKAVVRRARQVADYFYPANPPLMEQLALRAVLRLDQLRPRSLELSARNRELAAAWMAGRPDLEWSQPEGGFVGFARLRRADLDSHLLKARLARDGRTLVAPGHHFGDPRGFRVGLGVADEETLRAALHALGEALDGSGPTP